jgi:hypothetical protein
LDLPPKPNARDIDATLFLQAKSEGTNKEHIRFCQARTHDAEIAATNSEREHRADTGARCGHA